MTQYTRQQLLDLIDHYLANYGEGTVVDFKQEGYITRKDKAKKDVEDTKRDLIFDLTALANSNGVSLALLITGVNENNKVFTKVGINDPGICSDPNYQTLLEANVAPRLNFIYEEVTDNVGLTFGIFILENNIQRPYRFIKDVGKNDKLIKVGSVPYRVGSNNRILGNWITDNLPNHNLIQQWQQIDKIASNATIPSLLAFQSIQKSPLNLGHNRDLFEHDLLFFTPTEQQTIVTICTTLLEYHQALLVGYPASGKSIMARAIAEAMQAHNYEVYYYSFKYETAHELWADIRPQLNQCSLFIVDDCHLNMEQATNLYRLSYGGQVKSCLLFISRQIDTDIQEVTADFNFFEELSDQTFSSEINKSTRDEKIVGIVEKYRHYFQKIYQKSYKIGNLNLISQRVHADLLLLSCYLEVWEHEDIALSNIYQTRVLHRIYTNYWKNLTPIETTCLLHYAALYTFEIWFEPLTGAEYDQATQSLLAKGIILRQSANRDRFVFYHAIFANLLIESYLTEKDSLLKRQYRAIPNWQEHFWFEQIRAYILAFQTYGYPLNLYTILEKLVNFQKTTSLNSRRIVGELLRLTEVKSAIATFCQAEIQEISDLKLILVFSVRTCREQLPDLFNQLILGQPKFKSWLFRSTRPLFNYYQILSLLESDAGCYQQFYEILTPTEKETLWHHGTLYDIGSSIRIFKKTQLECIQRVKQFTIDELTAKTITLTLKQIGVSLATLKNIDLQIVCDIFQRLDIDVLIDKAKQTTFDAICQALNEFNGIDTQKTQVILQQLDITVLVDKTKQVGFEKIGIALNELKKIDQQKARAVLQQLDIAMLVDKARQASLGQISNVFNQLKDIDLQKIQKIMQLLDLNTTILTNEARQKNFSSVGQTLYELNKIDPQKAQVVLQQLDVTLLANKARESTFNDIGRSLNQLSKIDSRKTQMILQQLDITILADKAKKVSFQTITALNELNNIDSQITQAIFQMLDTTFLGDKVKQKGFEKIGHALNELKNIDSQIAQTVLYQLDTNMLIGKVMQVSFEKIGRALNELNKIDPQIAQEIFERLDTTMLMDKAMQVGFEKIGQSLNALKNVDLHIAQAILQQLDTTILADKAMQVSFEKIGIALSELKKVDFDKTINILRKIPYRQLVEKINYTEYMIFMRFIVIFPQIDPNYSHRLFSQIDESYLIQMKYLARLDNFNRLLFSFHHANLPVHAERLVKFAQERLHGFLTKNDLAKVQFLLELLENYMELRPLIETYFKEFQNKILYSGNSKDERIQKALPNFIGLIHKHHPEKGRVLLKRFAQRYPKDNETIAFAHYNFGKNEVAIGKIKSGQAELTLALTMFTELNHVKGLELTRMALAKVG